MKCSSKLERFMVKGSWFLLRQATRGRDKYMAVPEGAVKLVGNSYLNDKMKRMYLRIVDERVKRFVRKSE